MSTAIPKKRYYVILFVLLTAGIVALGSVFIYAREQDRDILAHQLRELERVSNRFDYRQCRDTNEIKSVIHTIIEANLALPEPAEQSEAEKVYRALLESYLVSPELAARNCLVILRRSRME